MAGGGVRCKRGKDKEKMGAAVEIEEGKKVEEIIANINI